MCVYTSIWNKTYCRKRLSLGMYGLHVKSRTFITPHTFCVLYRLLEIHGEELVFFFKLSPPTEKWSMTVCILHEKVIRGNVCFPGMALSRKKFIPTLPSPVYWTMVGTSNFCNISASRQMPSQVTLFFINIKIDCSSDLRTQNICKKNHVTLRLSANPSPSGSCTGLRIHWGDVARCSKIKDWL